jgi:tungstate transport system substrate-binding protein
MAVRAVTGGNGRYWAVAALPLLTVLYRPLPPVTADVILATTTSTRDAGLLDSLLPLFERDGTYRVKVIAVGSGQALEMGRRGDADVVLSHAPREERELFQAGYFTRRLPLMHNSFLLIGPPGDPAGLRGQKGALAAFARLSQAGAAFVSRGDRSGTHQMELDLWDRAGVVPPGRGARYTEAGQGMGPTLQIADQRRAYTLTDRATYLAWRHRLALVPVVDGDSLLANVYHVLEVNPRNSTRVNSAGARALVDFLTSPAARALIERFGRARFGEPLFIPDSLEAGS